MEKNAIKKFAVWARRELIERVSQKAMQYGIEKDTIVDDTADSINGKILTDTQKNQRKTLISQIKTKGYEEVMEEVAYTWFNRFIALRFMEVNGYLPTHVRVFTNEENNFKPQIIDEALHLDLDGLNIDKVYEFKNTNQTEELYKYLLITQCNALNSILPKMFQHISDYTELLLPDNLLHEGSIIEQMISTIPEEDWQDAVQIIGWLYQYYNTEKKDDVFAALKKNIKITKENIPAATQLFTPDWIVRYMVENSLGRLWVEGHPNDELKSSWKYYLEEAQQEPEVQEQLAKIRKEYATMTPEQIKCIDPCCGSGHILAYLFDVLVQIYESYGYTTREAVENIVKNNLYGLDIDDRAAQLAYFTVMMKARQYDRRFFSRHIQPNVYAIQESNNIDTYTLEYFCDSDTNLKIAINIILEEMHDAKEYGSILNITPVDFDALYTRFNDLQDNINLNSELVLNNLLPLVQIAEILAQKYDVVCTNPPYMGSSGMSAKLLNYVKKNYPDSKSDLFACCIEKGNKMTTTNGFNCMVTMQSWMFLNSFEKMRTRLLRTKDIINLMHMGNMVMGIAFGTAVTVFRNNHISDYKGTYNHITILDIENEHPKEFPIFKNRFAQISTDNFFKIPGNPIAYWVRSNVCINFLSGILRENIDAVKGLDTCDNDRFVRTWFEVDFSNIGLSINSTNDTFKHRWFPYCKGGGFRKWYGFLDKVVDWSNDGKTLRNLRNNNGKIKSRPQNTQYYFQEGLTFSTITSYKLSLRYMNNSIFGGGGSGVFSNNKNIIILLCYINSKVAEFYLNLLNPTLNFLVGDLLSLPYKEITNSEKIKKLGKQNIHLSSVDYNSFETSWDFIRHPMVPSINDKKEQKQLQFLVFRMEKFSNLSWQYENYKSKCEDRFQILKLNEEELNHIFIDIYGLQNELTPEVADKDVTVYRIFDNKEDIPESMVNSKYALTKQDVIKSLISYAVGCMFGRYSLDIDGLAYAGGEWNNVYKHNPSILDPEKEDGSIITLAGDVIIDKNGQYHLCTFAPDKDNIIPICNDEYFNDDIVGLFVKFIEIVYGKDTLEENLKFIADALGGKGQPKEVIRRYFLNDFYKDHCKTYQKRPIYWLFDSGKKNGFKALIYMHRYQPDTIARIRTDYVHEQQSRYHTAITDMENRIVAATSTSERIKLNKALTKLKDQDTELRNYEEKIHHLADQMIDIDLDDGVKVNYAKFQDVLAKIK